MKRLLLLALLLAGCGKVEDPAAKRAAYQAAYDAEMARLKKESQQEERVRRQGEEAAAAARASVRATPSPEADSEAIREIPSRGIGKWSHMSKEQLKPARAGTAKKRKIVLARAPYRPTHELLPGGIPINFGVDALIVDDLNDRICTAGQRGVTILSLSKREVIRSNSETGGSRLRLTPDGRDLWLSGANLIARFNMEAGRPTEGYRVAFTLRDFVVVRSNVWAIGGEATLIWTSLGSRRQIPIPIRLTSLAYDPTRDRLLGGVDGVELIEIDQSKLASTLGDMADIEDMDDPRIEKLFTAFEKSINRYELRGADEIENPFEARLIVEPSSGRLYYNQHAFQIEALSTSLGRVREGEILAASKDGRWVATDTRIYRTKGFTEATQLPFIGGPADFSADGRYLWIFDGHNRHVVPFPLPRN